MVPADERINVPGSLDPTNWTWRMPHAIEELVADADLRQRIRSVVSARTDRPL
jgi:4-alpha-glucanotransferase